MMTPEQARATMDRYSIPRANFYTLTSDQTDRIIQAADAHRYRKPKNANGSRARYFHALLMRRAGPCNSRD